ncbi:MAG: hypothetical protein RMI91_08740 [Gemmatales bacterium]|nr:hypothetical protein [Gemmatales bacterium]MDW7994727.1 hypothetical protein [Gemmatales bacterium]
MREYVPLTEVEPATEMGTEVARVGVHKIYAQKRHLVDKNEPI